MRPAGLEPTTYRFEVCYSIRVSYRRLKTIKPEVDNSFLINRVDDGSRTRDNKIHNLVLYP